MKKIQLPVEKACVLSTAHISMKDAELLDSLQKMDNVARLPRIQAHQHGWLVFLSAADKDACQSQRLDFSATGFSQAFLQIFDLACQQGISILDFDNAGEQVDGLQKFNW